jgi:hypothetical protein
VRPSLLRHWRVWLPLAVALPVLVMAFLFFTPLVRPALYDAIQPGMTAGEVYAIKDKHDRHEESWQIMETTGCTGWQSPDDDLILLQFSDSGGEQRLVKKEVQLAPFI